MDTEEKDFTKGFNNAYLLAKHQPELLNKVMSNLNRDNIYCQGMYAGKKEYDLEKSKNYFKQVERGGSSEKTKDKSDKGRSR